MAADYNMAPPDDILLKRPEIVTERPTLPRDLDPEFFERNANFYKTLRTGQRPGYLLGNYLNPYRRGESVNLFSKRARTMES